MLIDTVVSQELQQLAKILAHVKHQNHIYLNKIIPCFLFKSFIVLISTYMKKTVNLIIFLLITCITLSKTILTICKSIWKCQSLSYCIQDLPLILTDSCSDDKISLLFSLLSSWFEVYWGR